MIGLIAKFLLARNPALTLAHAKRLATGLLILLGVLLLVGGAALWLHFHDQGVEEKVLLERDNTDLRANAAANETAGVSMAEREKIEAREQKELEDEVDEAEAAGRSAADDLWSGDLFDPEP
jgi:ABC-type Na+ efflux pump permease subunit